jgi:hypothetical protein
VWVSVAGRDGDAALPTTHAVDFWQRDDVPDGVQERGLARNLGDILEQRGVPSVSGTAITTVATSCAPAHADDGSLLPCLPHPRPHPDSVPVSVSAGAVPPAR